MVTASEALTLQLRVGRFLRGPLLTTAVLMRNMTSSLMTDGLGGDALVAPAWVIVRDRASGSKVLRVPAGREAGAGEALLAVMQEEATVMERDSFLGRWRER